MLNECGSSHNFIDRALDRHSFGKFEKNHSRVDLPFQHFLRGKEETREPADLANGLPCARENTRKNTTLLAIVQRLNAINLVALNVHPVLRIVSIKFGDSPARPRPISPDRSRSVQTHTLASKACSHVTRSRSLYPSSFFPLLLSSYA